jgi:hypothetical protein
MSQDTLVSLCVAKDTRLLEMEEQERMLRKKLRRMECQALAPQDQAAMVDADFRIERRGSKRLSVKGTLALAIRKNMANVGGADLGAVILEDLGKKAVYKSEMDLAGSFIAAFRSFHETCEEDMKDGPNASFAVACHAFSSDATNSSVWQQSKLHSTLLQSSYLMDASLLERQPLHQCQLVFEGFCDLQCVVDARGAQSFPPTSP